MSNFIVTPDAMRPASQARACFYCHRGIGDTHKDDCVLINRTVRIRMTVEYDVSVPNFWDREMIEFHRNDSSWCANNALRELDEIDVGCLCECTNFEYVEERGPAYLDEK